MDLIYHIFEEDIGFNNKQISVKNEKQFIVVEKVRNLIIKENQICLIHTNKHNFTTFPGGGVEQNETPLNAVKRETKEEVGCFISEPTPFKITVEHRNKEHKIQITYYFLSNFLKNGKSNLTTEEIAEETNILWADLSTCLNNFETNNLKVYHINFSTYRDIFILKKYYMQIGSEKIEL